MPIATEKNLEELSPFELSLFLEKKSMRTIMERTF